MQISLLIIQIRQEKRARDCVVDAGLICIVINVWAHELKRPPVTGLVPHVLPTHTDDMNDGEKSASLPLSCI